MLVFLLKNKRVVLGAQTVLLLGHFGSATNRTVNPVKVEVVGDLRLRDGDAGETISAKGLEVSNDVDMVDYASASIRVVRAELEKFSVEGEFLVPPNPATAQAYPNHCESNFGQGSTTHRLRVILNGGFTVDGVQAYVPSDKEIFDVVMQDGSHIVDDSKYLGLADTTADASDLDNVFDLCLNLSDSEAADIASVHMPCTPGTKQAGVPPKGFPPCRENSLEVAMLL